MHHIMLQTLVRIDCCKEIEGQLVRELKDKIKAIHIVHQYSNAHSRSEVYVREITQPRKRKT
jgi:hypothetical protein